MSPRWIGVLLACSLGSGCAVGPDFHRPPAPIDQGYGAGSAKTTASADGRQQAFVMGQSVSPAWWKMLRSPSLDATVARALAGNPGLEAARATLRQNQDLLRAGYGVFLPQASVQAGATRQLSNPAPGAVASSTFNLFSLSGTVSYALDIWGGERRQVEALGAAVDAQRYTLAGAYVMLTSNVVDAVIAQAGYRAQIDATNETLVLLREQVRIAKAQVAAGTVPESTLLSLQSQMASTSATVPALEQRVDQASHLLAALSGMTPDAAGKPPVVQLADLELPDRLPLSLPSALVRQRPDVLVAEATLHAANANIGVATAAMLPNLTLSANYGFNNSSAGSLLSSQSALWGIGAGLTQPVLQEGSLNEQRKAAIEARNATAALYRQTVLGAFEQVADTLRGLGHDADAVIAEREAVEAARKAAYLMHANYEAGIATYLQVLVVDIQYQQAKIGYLQAVAQRLQDTVALYAALGGGWWNAPEASHG